MIFSRLIKLTLTYRSLEVEKELLRAALGREKEVSADLKAERDDYRDRWQRQIEYDRVADGKPYPTIAERRERTQTADTRVSRQDIEDRIKQRQNEDFADYQRQQQARLTSPDASPTAN